MRALAAVAAVAVFVVAGCTSDGGTGVTPTPGPVQPSFALLNPGQVTFPAGGPVLLSFLDPPAASSRSQVVVLRSMGTQYTAAGLTVVVVDATGKATSDSLTNYAYDWNLGAAGVKVAAPATASALRTAYQVTAAPDTVLLAADGTVQQRWRGSIATAQDVAMAIQRLLPSTSPSAVPA